MSSRLANKRAVVTGGSSGIGYETARQFVSEGAEVIITGRNAETIHPAAAQLGAKGFVSDQSDLRQIEQLATQIEAQYGKIDILFINAGMAAFAPLGGITEAHFDQVFNANFKGALFTLQQFLPLLNDHASVILLSSINAYNAMGNTAVYAASKAALNSLTKVAAQELAPRGIRVNTVLPGPVATPLWGKVGMDEETLSGMAAVIQSKVPLRKFGTPEEIARTVVFLASAESSYTTGAEFVVDGGFNLNALVG